MTPNVTKPKGKFRIPFRKPRTIESKFTLLGRRLSSDEFADIIPGARSAVTPIILVLLCLFCYNHALNGTYVFDDSVAISKNPDVIKLPTNFSAIFTDDFWGEPLRSVESHKSWRPLTTLMFHIEYAYLGMRAHQMKVVNLMLHSANTLLVQRLFRSFTWVNKDNIQIATLAAALFAVHPVHTEAVCGAVSRAELMFCLLYLLALLCTSTRECMRKNVADVLILLLTVLGILFKETAVTIPLACVFLDYIQTEVFRKPWRLQLPILLSSRNLFYGVFTTMLIYGRYWLQNFESPQFKSQDNPVAFHDDLLTRILSQNYLYAINLWILLCPQWLSFDWALGCVDLIKSVWDLRLQGVLGMYSFIIVALINFKNNVGTILGLGLLVIPFLPASGIIKVGFVIAERVLYVPSVGFCFLVAYSILYVLTAVQQKWLKGCIKVLYMLLILTFVLRTRQRASEWLNEEQLFTSALQVCPNNAKVHYNIARLATDMNQQQKAFRHYHKAIKLYPEYESALMNLGNMYREVGDLELSEKYIKSALKAYPQFATAWMNLGITQAARKKYKESFRSYSTALKYRNNYAICLFNMGNLFLEQKRYTDAMKYWQKTLAINMRDSKAWANILTMLDTRELYEDALRMSEKALKHLPDNLNIMFLRANVLGKLKRYMEAETLYKHVIKTEPKNYLFHSNLGVLYHRWDKIDLAIASYQRAVNLNADEAKTACENLNKLKKRRKQQKLKGEPTGAYK